jgi:hypothetical protein
MQLQAITTSDQKSLHIASQQLAYHAAKDSCSPGPGPQCEDKLHTPEESTEASLMRSGQLKSILTVTERIMARLEKMQSSRSHFSLGTNANTWSGLPLFETLLGEADLENLAGPAAQPAFRRDIDFLLVPDKADSLGDVVCALRHCERLCTLLSNQRAQIKNAASLQIALIQHLFTVVVPLPAGQVLCTPRTQTHRSSVISGSLYALPGHRV